MADIFEIVGRVSLDGLNKAEKEKIITIPKPKEEAPDLSHEDNWVTDMKSDMEEYIEEQGIYIRQ